VTIIRALTPEVQLAQEFQSTLTDARSPWAALYDQWAAERGLSTDMARAVKVTVLRLRMFGGGKTARRASR
jgi:hypothetical protein